MKECILWIYDFVDCFILEIINIWVYVFWYFIFIIGFVYIGNEFFFIRFVCCIFFMIFILYVVILLKEKCVIKYFLMWILIENFKFFIRYFVYIDMVYKGYFFCYILFWWSVDMFLRWCYIVMDKYICVDRFLLCYCIGYICKIVYSL